MTKELFLCFHKYNKGAHLPKAWGSYLHLDGEHPVIDTKDHSNAEPEEYVIAEMEKDHLSEMMLNS